MSRPERCAVDLRSSANDIHGVSLCRLSVNTAGRTEESFEGAREPAVPAAITEFPTTAAESVVENPTSFPVLLRLSQMATDIEQKRGADNVDRLSDEKSETEGDKRQRVAQNGYRTSANLVVRRLNTIVNDEKLEKLESMNRFDVPRELEKVTDAIIKECIETTICYESIKQTGNQVRETMRQILEDIEGVAEDYINGSQHNRKKLKAFFDGMIKIRKLVLVDDPKDNKMKKMEMQDFVRKQIETLKECIQARVEAMENDVPEHIANINLLPGARTLEQMEEVVEHKREKRLRSLLAQSKALREYSSFTQLESEARRLGVLAVEPTVEEEVTDDEMWSTADLKKRLDAIEALKLQIAKEAVIESALEAIRTLCTDDSKFDEGLWKAILAALDFGYRYDFTPYEENYAVGAQKNEVRAVFEFIRQAVAVLTSTNSNSKNWFENNRYGVKRVELERFSDQLKDLEEKHYSKFKSDKSDESDDKKALFEKIVDVLTNMTSMDPTKFFDVKWWDTLEECFEELQRHVSSDFPEASIVLKFVSEAAVLLKRINPETIEWFKSKPESFKESVSPDVMIDSTMDAIPEEIVYESDFESDFDSD